MSDTQKKACAALRIMSSNILFDKSLADRLPLIADYYLASGADIIGMQEVNGVGSGLYAKVSGTYTPLAVAHADGKRCFSPILYRTDRFDVVECGSELHRKRATDTKSMAWAVLCDRVTGKRVALINTHSAIILPSHKLNATNSVEGEAWRLDNVIAMLEKRDELLDRYGKELPVFICGDFNSKLGCDSIEAMRLHMSDSADVAAVSSTHNVCSYHGAPGRGCVEGSPIDFIFVTENVKILTHTIPTDEKALAISDHCPVIVGAEIG